MSARLVVLASLATAALAMPIVQNLHDRSYYEEKFFNWLSEFKVEASNGDHFVKMIQNFANNDDIITQHNNQNLSYTLGHNQFSHLSVEEYREYVKLGLNKPAELTGPDAIHEAPADVSANPASVNWVTAGAVTGVKDQGQCGSCWSFSTTGAIEGANAIKTKTTGSAIKSFSEQHLVDCDNLSHHFGRDHGCSGGLMDNAFSWINKNNGICTEATYPYVSGTTKTEGTCDESKCTKDVNSIPASYVDVEKNSDAAMMSALALGPVAIAIEADEKAFQLYTSGVLTAACGTNLDHGVLAVGYGTENGVDYYNVKNSWGTSWGDKGYIKLARGIAQKEGQCGMLSSASYPLMK
jgi:C1A family cysteine protease